MNSGAKVKVMVVVWRAGGTDQEVAEGAAPAADDRHGRTHDDGLARHGWLRHGHGQHDGPTGASEGARRVSWWGRTSTVLRLA